MKIERINDRQIRCTLTSEDLTSRGLRLSEFAYGTKKARELFQDMMEQASAEVGFEAEDYPLMIEAVPMGPDCLVLIVTQVEDPEELDTRFAAFGPMMDEMDEEDYEERDDDDMENSFYRMLRGMQDNDYSAISEQFAARLDPRGTLPQIDPEAAQKQAGTGKGAAARIFVFGTLHEVQRAATVAASDAAAVQSTLYRDSGARRFYLCLRPASDPGSDRKTPPAFLSLCKLLDEYGAAQAADTLSEEYLREHCEPLIPQEALQKLAGIA